VGAHTHVAAVKTQAISGCSTRSARARSSRAAPDSRTHRGDELIGVLQHRVVQPRVHGLEVRQVHLQEVAAIAEVLQQRLAAGEWGAGTTRPWGPETGRAEVSAGPQPTPVAQALPPPAPCRTTHRYGKMPSRSKLRTKSRDALVARSRVKVVPSSAPPVTRPCDDVNTWPPSLQAYGTRRTRGVGARASAAAGRGYPLRDPASRALGGHAPLCHLDRRQRGGRGRQNVERGL
jgi:hypothetical protein